MQYLSNLNKVATTLLATLFIPSIGIIGTICRIWSLLCPETSTRREAISMFGSMTFNHPFCALMTHKQINIEPQGKGELVEYGTN